MKDAPKEERTQFAIFRARDGVPYEKAGVMYGEPVSDLFKQEWPKLRAAGFDDGQEVKLLFSVGGMSLTYVWFKSGFQLPRHSHNVDCLYYVIAGSLQIGSEVLGPGDGFFVGTDVPYTYTPGATGVEVLEFRNRNSFSMKFLAENPAFWSKAIDIVRDSRPQWAEEPRPSAALSVNE